MIQPIFKFICVAALAFHCAANPIEVTSASTEKITAAETVGVAEKIRNAFKLLLLANSGSDPSNATLAQLSTTDKSEIAEATVNDDSTTAFAYITVFETTEEQLEEDRKTKPFISDSATLAQLSTTVKSETTKAAVTDDSDSTTEFAYITVFETTEEQLNEDRKTKPFIDVTTDPSNSTTIDSQALQNSTSGAITERNQNPFKFIIMNRSTSTEKQKYSTTAISLPTTSPKETTVKHKDDSTYTNEFAYITVYATTIEPAEETSEGRGFERTTPKTSPTSTTRQRTTRRRPSTTRTTTRGVTKKKTSTTKKTKDGDVIYELKNSGIQFIIKSTTANPSTKTKSKETNSPPISNGGKSTINKTPITDSPEIWEEYFTTDETNGSLVVGGVLFGGAEGPVAAIGYFPYPAIFWAKYWYWILIILLLIIFLFIIPGFFCQIYLSKWCKKRKLHRFFDKRSHIFDFEKIGLWIRKTKSQREKDLEGEHAESFPSSESSFDVEEVASNHTSSGAGDESIHFPASSLPEADIHQQQSNETKPSETVNSGSGNATIIVIPDPMSEISVNPISESLSDGPPIQPSFEFPEPANDASNAIALPVRTAPSTHSESDVGLDIGNETIIKSNSFTKPLKIAPPPAFLPPKPQHMIPQSKPREIAPPNRPRRTVQKKREEVRRHRGELNPKYDDKEISVPMRRAKRSNSPRKKQGTKKRPTKIAKKNKTRKNTETSTESIMKAAKSLEDILEAITKLTREYPVPNLTEINGRGKEAKQTKCHRDKRRRDKSDDMAHKPSTQERTIADAGKRHLPDEDMLRRKEKRTKNWANDQRKIEKGRDRKKRRPEKKSPHKKDADLTRQNKKKKEEKKGSKRAVDEKAVDEAEKVKKKVPTLLKEELPSQDKTKQERRRLRLERDLKKLQRYHNHVAKKNKDKDDETNE